MLNKIEANAYKKGSFSEPENSWEPLWWGRESAGAQRPGLAILTAPHQRGELQLVSYNSQVSIQKIKSSYWGAQEIHALGCCRQRL